MERNYFASNLRYLRKINKVTQAAIAEKIGKTPSLITMWESGKREPILADVRLVADFFNIPLGDIIGTDLLLNYNDSILTQYETELIDGFRNLTPDQQQAVLTLVKGMAKV